MKLLLAALVAAFFPALLQAATPGVPDAGSILQQVQPVTPPVPAPGLPALTIEGGGAATLPSSAPFEVKSVLLSGNTVFDTATLHALVADAEGKPLTLDQLGELAARITEYYRSRGYPLARAIIPAQSIQSGVVRIQIIEARYGNVKIDNRSRVNDLLLETTLSSLQSGQAIEQTGLDRALLLLADIPGVVVGATVKPGETVGTSDLLVTTTAGSAFSGHVVADNYGDRFTGRARVGGTMYLNNPLHHGDVLSMSLLSSGRGVNFGRLAYELLLNGQGTRMGGSYSALHYILGDPLSSLNAHGTAGVAGLWATHPLVRSRDLNLNGRIQYDLLKLRDHIDASGIQTDRHVENRVASLAGDLRDTLFSSAISTWSVGVTSGRVGFDDEAARLADGATVRTEGRFWKWNATLSRLQSLTPKSTLYLVFSHQWANANLDSSQKMSVGGPYTVRAYDTGAISGDTGYFGTVELRHDLGAIGGWQWQAIAFVDSAKVTVNKVVWVAGTNHATLSGAGLGLSWVTSNQWRAKTYLATRIGSTPVLVATTESTRGWVEIGKGF